MQLEITFNRHATACVGATAALVQSAMTEAGCAADALLAKKTLSGGWSFYSMVQEDSDLLVLKNRLQSNVSDGLQVTGPIAFENGPVTFVVSPPGSLKELYGSAKPH